LKAAEDAVGISNNIVRETLFGFIPRPLWPGKPIVGDFGLWFSRLYLDLASLTSNGPTVFGDLYRNFGFLGIPFGLFILGLAFRVIYESLIVRGIPTPLNAVLYISLISVVNWEATISPVIANGLRVLFAFGTFVVVLAYLVAGKATT
jgi:oligosaccharide repeat unit polymerase